MPSRREFLVRCLQVTVAMPSGISALAQLVDKPSEEFSRDELNLLAAAMDEIIPQTDGMPSASGAGGIEYLQQLGWQYESIAGEIGAFLRLLQQESQKEFGTGFAALEDERRFALMKRIEKSDPKLFSSFVTYVYEAYYTRPQVQGLLSCSIPPVAADDESLLAPVRKLAPLYRKCHEE
jgi:Gluconate 2-dehydrogenase subunit 3